MERHADCMGGLNTAKTEATMSDQTKQLCDRINSHFDEMVVRIRQVRLVLIKVGFTNQRRRARRERGVVVDKTTLIY